MNFKEHPDAWTKSHEIILNGKHLETKLYGLDVLADAVVKQWATINTDQRMGIRNFLVNTIIELASEHDSRSSHSAFLNKLNLTLVKVVIREWPNEWPDFISEIVEASKTSESLCTNNMQILKFLSEEIHEYWVGNLTSSKVQTMKEQLNQDFQLVYQLCEFVLSSSKDEHLLLSTLETLHAYLKWIPVGFIFETDLIKTLALTFFPAAMFQNVTLECLCQIGSLKLKNKDYDQQFIALFGAVITHCMGALDNIDIAEVYAEGDDSATLFVRHLSMFISGFLRSHLSLLETSEETVRLLKMAMTLLLRISEVEDEVIFKICLECWSLLVADLYNTSRSEFPRAMTLGSMQSQQPGARRLMMYSHELSRLRLTLVTKMPRPEEVLIVQDASGEWIRERMKDTDSIILYKSMRECLIFLTHLDPDDTQQLMIMKLAKQVSGEEWSHNNLNTLCWAIGSVSGAMNENMEKTFLVRVIKDLLSLCEAKKGKDNKAVVASNIMYVVGQYPRFLRKHWKFLRTVITKLFEFMHEPHPGVKDMSCETFVKISKKCARKFVTLQNDESEPFIVTIIGLIHRVTAELEHSQIQIFYEACALIIKAETDRSKQQNLVYGLMEIPNTSWARIVAEANEGFGTLCELNVIREVVQVLKVNRHVAESLGHGYMVQLGRIYLEMLHVYKLYSAQITQVIAEQGDHMSNSAPVRAMRAVKTEILRIMRSFVENCHQSDQGTVQDKFLPALVEPVLTDYAQGIPQARDAEVLSLFAAIIEKFGDGVMKYLPLVFESCFESTLSMITLNFTDFPDHRKNFFLLIRAINAKCFESLLSLSQEQFKIVMDSITWAFKDIEKNVAETGLTILDELLQNVSNSEVEIIFYQTYLISLLQDLLGVLTDAFHKPGFHLHSKLLMHLFQVVDRGVITTPLSENYANNQMFVRDFTINYLSESFQHVHPDTIKEFVNNLFNCSDSVTFKVHLRDFLVSIKEKQNVNELFFEENAEVAKAQQQQIDTVPGLAYEAPPSRNEDEDMF